MQGREYLEAGDFVLRMALFSIVQYMQLVINCLVIGQINKYTTHNTKHAKSNQEKIQKNGSHIDFYFGSPTMWLSTFMAHTSFHYVMNECWSASYIVCV